MRVCMACCANPRRMAHTAPNWRASLAQRSANPRARKPSAWHLTSVHSPEIEIRYLGIARARRDNAPDDRRTSAAFHLGLRLSPSFPPIPFDVGRRRNGGDVNERWCSPRLSSSIASCRRLALNHIQRIPNAHSGVATDGEPPGRGSGCL